MLTLYAHSITYSLLLDSVPLWCGMSLYDYSLCKSLLVWDTINNIIELMMVQQFVRCYCICIVTVLLRGNSVIIGYSGYNLIVLLSLFLFKHLVTACCCSFAVYALNRHFCVSITTINIQQFKHRFVAFIYSEDKGSQKTVISTLFTCSQSLHFTTSSSSTKTTPPYKVVE